MDMTGAKFMRHKNKVEQTLVKTILMECTLEQAITGKHRHMALIFW